MQSVLKVIFKRNPMTPQQAAEVLDTLIQTERAQAIQILEKLPYPFKGGSDGGEDVPSPSTPSGNHPVYLKPNHRKRRKKPGRKAGHQGKARKSPSHIDQFEHHTMESCPICDTTLGNPIRTRKRYIEDIPPVVPIITEHIIEGYWCCACKKMVEPILPVAMPNDTIGIRLYVFTAWMHYIVGISISNIVKMLHHLHGFSISAGGLVQGWQRLCRLLAGEYEKTGELARTSAVLHADETGWRKNGVTHWLWCFCNEKVCYYLIDHNRGSPVIKKFFRQIFRGILICDFWGAYNKIVCLAKQRCFFHLFTEIVKVDVRNQSSEWRRFRKKLSRLLKDTIRLWEKKKTFSLILYSRRKQKIENRLQILLHPSYEDKDCRRLIKRLKRHQNELFVFLEHEHVSPYNNFAEQQMRKPVISRRISQQNRSDVGTTTQAVMMSLFRTAELQHMNPVEHILQIAIASMLKAKGIKNNIFNTKISYNKAA